MRLKKTGFIASVPIHGWIGLLLVGVFWWLNWTLPGARTHWAFTPLWVGYCLFVDGLVYLRTGTSLLTRSWKAYLGLFGVSIFGWWMFEFFNWRLQNWTYLGREIFTGFEFSILASFSFSTVIPAVFETAELVGSFSWLKRKKRGLRIPKNRQTTLGFFVLGWLMLVLMLALPRYFFPFMWLSVFFILEPVNVWLSNRTLAEYVHRGDWHPVISLWLGALVCGFFWEMWNFYSFPKWVYHIPYLDFAHIFEMPLLGYGGYLPFAMELFALYHLAAGFLGRKSSWEYIQLPDEDHGLSFDSEN